MSGWVTVRKLVMLTHLKSRNAMQTACAKRKPYTWAATLLLLYKSCPIFLRGGPKGEARVWWGDLVQDTWLHLLGEVLNFFWMVGEWKRNSPIMWEGRSPCPTPPYWATLPGRGQCVETLLWMLELWKVNKWNIENYKQNAFSIQIADWCDLNLNLEIFRKLETFSH